MRIASIIGLTTAALAAHCVADVRGQELPLKTDLPPLPSNACEARGYVFQAESAPPAEAAAEAQRLTAEANQAAILGDVQRARSLLGEAAALDRTSSAISYVFGRQLEAGGEQEAALSEYCRFLGIDPDAAEVDDVEARIERIGTEVGALGAGPGRTALEDGIRTFELGDFDEAVLDFSRALVERPDWDQAHFNRAVAYLSSGRDAAGVADLEFYLEVAPDAEDRAEIEALLDEIGPLAEYSPSTALVSGLFIPGMGHFYRKTGHGGSRAWRGSNKRRVCCLVSGNPDKLPGSAH